MAEIKTMTVSMKEPTYLALTDACLCFKTSRSAMVEEAIRLSCGLQETPSPTYRLVMNYIRTRVGTDNG